MLSATNSPIVGERRLRKTVTSNLRDDDGPSRAEYKRELGALAEGVNFTDEIKLFQNVKAL